MSIRSFNVTYNDFELDQIIHPDEFDVNFADISIRMNQIIDVLNQITDGMGGNGADIIHVGDVFPFQDEKLQPFLESLIGRLQSTEGELSGAEFIGSMSIAGIEGNTVQEQLYSLKELLDGFYLQINSQLDTFGVRVDAVETATAETRNDMNAMETRFTDAESDIASRAKSSDVYTKTETDLNIDQSEASIMNNVYSKTQANNLLSNKLTIGGNHTGRWQGINISDIANRLGLSGVVLSENQPSNPTERMMWFKPSTNTYTLYLGGQWRIHGAPTQVKKLTNRVVLSGSSDTVDVGIENYNPTFDTLNVYVNSTYQAEGYDYTINPSGSITKYTGSWVGGTTIDFEVLVATPLDGRTDLIMGSFMIEEGENWEVVE